MKFLLIIAVVVILEKVSMVESNTGTEKHFINKGIDWMTVFTMNNMTFVNKDDLHGEANEQLNVTNYPLSVVPVTKLADETPSWHTIRFLKDKVWYMVTICIVIHSLLVQIIIIVLIKLYLKNRSRQPTNNISQIGPLDVKFWADDAEARVNEVEVGVNEVEVGIDDPKVDTHDAQIGTDDPEKWKYELEFGTFDAQIGTHDAQFGTDDHKV